MSSQPPRHQLVDSITVLFVSWSGQKFYPLVGWFLDRLVRQIGTGLEGLSVAKTIASINNLNRLVMRWNR